MQVLPDAHVPLPVHPIPPHCPYLAIEPPDAEAEEDETGDTVVIDVFIVVADEVGGTTVLVVDETLEGGGTEEPTVPPGPATEVVIDPDSIYTPLKYQSSTSGLVRDDDIGRRRTPRCQSAPLDEGLAATGATTCVNGSEPVECQNPTVLPEKSISYAMLCHTPTGA